MTNKRADFLALQMKCPFADVSHYRLLLLPNLLPRELYRLCLPERDKQIFNLRSLKIYQTSPWLFAVPSYPLRGELYQDIQPINVCFVLGQTRFTSACPGC